MAPLVCLLLHGSLIRHGSWNGYRPGGLLSRVSLSVEASRAPTLPPHWKLCGTWTRLPEGGDCIREFPHVSSFLAPRSSHVCVYVCVCVQEIHKKVMSLQFSECHTKIRQVDAHATLGDGVVVQVMGELSNSGRPMRRFMQTFVLASYGSAVNKFYVHNDIFRYEEEVFGDSEAELGESEEEEVEEEQVETPASPEPAPDRPSSTTYYEPPAPPVSNGVEEQQEEAEPEAEPEPQPEASQEAEAELNPEAELQVAEVEPEEEEERGSTPSLTLTPPPQTPEPLKAFSWALVTSKNLPPAHVVKAAGVQPRVELKQDGQSSLPRDQRRERPGFPPRGPRADGSGSEAPGGKQYISFKGEFQGELKEFFMTFGNMVEMRINTKGVGGRLPNFGFVVFDDSEPVQRILGSKPIMFRGEVRLNVEEKKSRAARERETRGAAEGRRGPRGPLGNGLGREREARGSSRAGMGAGRESRFTGPRR
ncbi:ras GTPase-activating protein-binding protein 2 [Sinocyclocheilus anshuiensis]|uniref:ras GTPase-activating protein-binding protein 2 n=1 Tax=Sinocyclocheilus anshuiensis TaxID=1608454 RepID=UPI0007B890BB|nr:PREDICTED: ras GTPase-activating protein-binding protein 2-like [Sinocyclocheilus anshuiensis]